MIKVQALSQQNEDAVKAIEPCRAAELLKSNHPSFHPSMENIFSVNFGVHHTSVSFKSLEDMVRVYRLTALISEENPQIWK